MPQGQLGGGAGAFNAVSFHPVDDPGLARAWDELAAGTAASPFARHGWFLAWGRAFGTRVEVAVSGADALAPVVRHARGIGVPVNQETPEYAFTSTSPAAADRLSNALLSASVPSYEFLKVGRAEAEAVRAAASGRRVVEEVMQRSPYLEITGRWEPYEASLGSSFRQGLRRKTRRLRAEGEMVFESSDGRDGLTELLREGFAVESSHWKAQQGTAIASRPDTRSFYEAIARWAADRGWLRLWFLRSNGVALAFRLDLVVAGVYYHVKGGYEPSHARYSPGLLLQHETVRYAFDHGFGRYEFLGADEPYKLNWTKTCRDRLAVRVYARDIRGTSAWLKRAVVRPAVQRLRRRVAR